MCAYVCISAHMYAYVCVYEYVCNIVSMCAYVWMYAAYVHEAWTYAIQPMHAAMVQTIDHRPLHKHMHLNLCMLQSCKQAVKELKHMQFNLYML